MSALRPSWLLVVALLAPTAVARAEGDAVAPLVVTLRSAESERAAVDARRLALEGQNGSEAGEIEHLKAEPAGIARDLRLGQLLAATQERSRQLDGLAADLRARDARLDGLRRQLADAARRMLAEPGVPEARRVEVARVLAATVSALAARPSGRLGIVRPGAVDALAGPAELDEQADRVKDDEDKLSREAERIGRRIAALEERHHLRERAASLDDDLFVESGVGRRVQRPDTQRSTSDSLFRGGGGAAATAGAPSLAASPAAPNVAGDVSAPPAVVLRGVLDPSTVDELRRAEQGQDADLELHALRRARAELATLSTDLARHETALRRRATELRRRK